MLIYYKGNLLRTRKKKTQCISGTEEMINMKGNRLMLRCTCASCGILKHSFAKQGGLLDVHKLIRKLSNQKVDLLFPVISTQDHIIHWKNSLMQMINLYLDKNPIIK